jgi:hypothetical protein
MIYLVEPKETAYNAKCIQFCRIKPMYGVPPIYCYEVV